MKMLTCTLTLVLYFTLFATACSNTFNKLTFTSETKMDQETQSVGTERKFWSDPGIDGNINEKPRLQDNAVANINYNWYTNTDIPDGCSSWAAYDELNLEVKTRMIETFKAPDDSIDQQKVATLFAAALDKDVRNSTGIGSIRDTLDALLTVNSIEELNQLFANDRLMAYFTPLIISDVSPDLKNSSVNVAYIYAPILSLQDSAEYTELTEQGKRIKEANDTYYKALLIHNGISETDANAMVSAAFDWETEIAKGMFSTEVTYQEDYYELIYNEYTPETFFKLAPNVPYQTALRTIGLGEACRFIVTEPKALKTLNNCYTEEYLSNIKAYLAITLLDSVSIYCDTFSEDAGIEWSNAVYGSSGRQPDEDRAYELCDNILNELVGKIYAEKYFDQNSKADITDMVNDIFGIYKQRLSAADWLDEKTRQTAIDKLETMTLRIGFPETYYFDWDKVKISADRPLIENVINAIVETSKQENAKVDKPVNKNIWLMSANTVNAYYNPSDNSINFPAAILNAPFYIAGGSRSENLGGIGAVIAHEITHAFDTTTGSKFDKDGNMVNWWTDNDRTAFESRTNKVAAYYESIEVLPGEYVHGDLTIGETVADLAAMASTLDILRKTEDADYEAYFSSWIRIWAQIITPEERSYDLKFNPHAPSYLRANVTVQQFQEFYDTYGIKEGDGMYVAPESRLEVW